MANTTAKTPLSTRAKPFIPTVDTWSSCQGSNNAQVPSQFVACIPVFFASDIMVSASDSAQKMGSGGQTNMEPDVAKPRRGRARTRDLPNRLPSRTPSPSGYSVCLSEISTTAESCFKQESVADLSTLSDPTDYMEDVHEMDGIPVKNTFVHFNKERLEAFNTEGGELKKLSRSSSAPSIVLTGPFKHFTMLEMHERGQCSPCAYLYAKADGCRLGSQCKFCHLCPADELKNRKKQKLKELKARKAAMKAALEAERGESDQPKSPGDVAEVA